MIDIAADGSRPCPSIDRSERGFTLIEMLVALAIFSLAALALLRLGGATATNSARLNDQAIAMIVAAQPRRRGADRSAAARLRHQRGRDRQCRPALALDAQCRPLARGPHPADRNRGRARGRRPRPRQPHPLPPGPGMRKSAQGFTLVEMLIALAIFGMITAAGRRPARPDRADAGELGAAARFAGRAQADRRPARRRPRPGGAARASRPRRPAAARLRRQ